MAPREFPSYLVSLRVYRLLCNGLFFVFCSFLPPPPPPLPHETKLHKKLSESDEKEANRVFQKRQVSYLFVYLLLCGPNHRSFLFRLREERQQKAQENVLQVCLGRAIEQMGPFVPRRATDLLEPQGGFILRQASVCLFGVSIFLPCWGGTRCQERGCNVDTTGMGSACCRT